MDLTLIPVTPTCYCVRRVAVVGRRVVPIEPTERSLLPLSLVADRRNMCTRVLALILKFCVLWLPRFVAVRLGSLHANASVCLRVLFVASLLLSQTSSTALDAHKLERISPSSHSSSHSSSYSSSHSSSPGHRSRVRSREFSGLQAGRDERVEQVEQVEQAERAAAKSQPVDKRKHIAIVSLSFRGHLIPLTRLATELVSRGHRVTLACHEDGKQYVNATGASFYSMGAMPHGSIIRQNLKRISHDPSFFHGILSLVQGVYVLLSEPVFESVVELIQSDRPDIIVSDIGALGAIDAAQVFEIPLVVNNPSGVFRLDSTPHSVPAWGSGLNSKMTTMDRCYSIVYPQLLSVALTPALMDINRMRKERGLPCLRSEADLFSRTLVLINTAAGFEVAQSLPPLMKMTGPLMPVRPYRPSMLHHHLPSGLYKFLSETSSRVSALVQGDCTGMPQSGCRGFCCRGYGENGACDDGSCDTASDHSSDAYASMDIGKSSGSLNEGAAVPLSAMGSAGKHKRKKLKHKTVVVLFGQGGMSHLLPWQIKHLATALHGLRVRVLWALHVEHRSPVLQSTQFSVKHNFRPLPALAHPSVRVVISSCGMGSAQEALYYAKPLLCIPIFGDQVDVTMRVVDAGVGIGIDKMLLNAITLKKALHKLLRNSSYRHEAKNLAKLLRSTGGTQTAASAVESVMNDGIDHLILHGKLDMPWHKTKQLDVLAVFVSIVALCVVFTHAVFSFAVHVYYWIAAYLDKGEHDMGGDSDSQPLDDVDATINGNATAKSASLQNKSIGSSG